MKLVELSITIHNYPKLSITIHKRLIKVSLQITMGGAPPQIPPIRHGVEELFGCTDIK